MAARKTDHLRGWLEAHRALKASARSRLSRLQEDEPDDGFNKLVRR